MINVRKTGSGVIVEIIRGLGLGGAENLLFKRIEFWVTKKMILPSEVKIVNTAPTSSYYASAFRELGVELVESRSSSPLDGYRAVSSVLKGLGPRDSVIFHSPLPSYLIKFRRFISSQNGPLLFEVVHSTSYRGLYMAMGDLLDRIVDHAIWVSEDVQHSRVGRSFRTGTVLTGGVDREAMRAWITQNPSAWVDYRHKLGLEKNDKLVVAVAGLRPEKRHTALVEAFASPSLEGHHLALIGEGSERSSIEARIHDLGLEDHVHLLGSQANGWKWTAIADVIAQPSSHEGLPVSLMEAAALGTPIAATNVGGVKNILEDRGLGRFIPDQSISAISDTLNSLLSQADPIQEVFPNRATRPVKWDLGTFAMQFLALINDQSERVNSR